MGLLGNVLQLGGGVLGSIINGNKNKKAISKASRAEIDAYNRGLNLISEQQERTRVNFAPYVDRGHDALSQLSVLMGLRGEEPQAAQLAKLRDSPLFHSLYDSGEEALLQTASATGGLRGGNTQRGLADFGADTFSTVLEQQLQRLGGIAGMGSNAAASTGSFGANAATQGAGLLGNIGQSQSGAILGRQQIDNNMFSQIQRIMASIATGGFGGGMGGGGMAGAGGFSF